MRSKTISAATADMMKRRPASDHRCRRARRSCRASSNSAWTAASEPISGDDAVIVTDLFATETAQNHYY